MNQEEFQALVYRAERGNAEAQIDVGKAYYSGLYGQKKDLKKAVKWYQMSAKRGNSQGLFLTGKCHERGKGVLQNFTIAMEFYKKSAEQGYPDAQYALGSMYLEGKGVAQNSPEAARWFRLSAEQGNVLAQTWLGVMYAAGNGVAQNRVKGHMWVNIAASASLDDEVADKVATFREKIAKDMTSEEILEAQQLAQKCVERNFKDC